MFANCPCKTLAVCGLCCLLAGFMLAAGGASLALAGETVHPAKNVSSLRLENTRSLDLQSPYAKPHLLAPRDLQYALEIQPGTAVKSFSRNMAALMHLTSQRTTWRDLWNDILSTKGAPVVGTGKMISYVGLSSVAALVDSVLSRYYDDQGRGLITRLKFVRAEGPGVSAKLHDMAEMELPRVSELVFEYRF